MNDPSPVVLEQRVLSFGNIASNGCSFGATWVTHDSGRTWIAGRTYRVVGGAWQGSAVANLGSVVSSGLSPDIAWDGTSYIVVWGDGQLRLRRMAEDGSVLGSEMASYDAPGNNYVRWLHAADDSLRVGYSSNAYLPGYEPFFAHIVHDDRGGTAPLALTDVGPADVLGFMRDDSANLLQLTAGANQRITLFELRFDDDGDVLGEAEPLLDGINVLGSRRGVAKRGDAIYFGALVVDGGQELVVARRTALGHQRVAGVTGGDIPVLASTRSGSLGVLAATDRGSTSSELELSILRGDAVVETSVLPVQARSYYYGMAGGEETLGILAALESSVTFWSWRP